MALLRALHRWLGLGLAVIVIAVAASGGLLLFRDPYYRAVHPELREPPRAAEHAARARVLTAIESRWRADGIRLVKLPQSGLNAYHVWLSDGSQAFVHPRTGAVIDRWQPTERLPALLFELHAHLLAGRGGSFVNGTAALFVAFMALTGIVLWWPARRGAFRLRGMLPRQTTSGELLRSHAAVGAVAALPIVIFALTGALIVFYDPAASLLSAWLDRRPPTEPSARVSPRRVPPRPWTEVLQAVDRTFPDGRTVFYYPGGHGNARLMFRKQLPGEWHPNGRSYVSIDPYTANVVEAIDARLQGTGTRMMHAVYPVHAAKVGGLPMVLLAALAAAALTWLAAGGGWTYMSRWQLARRAARRAAVPLAARAPARRQKAS